MRLFTLWKYCFLKKIITKEYLDHELEGHEWQGSRELHIGGDFLLVYRLSDKDNLITFVDIGSHSELFG
ncbi:type II toxin-antitoxin system mRNA interferase toxin, RelE/StbE family [Providencia huaxiensis]|uniref:type II toxin-antitoxin system mRNA interferase toxin, RelE/StbE family n=1 Tax=Providencia huaxiensis TaxID=2027290 RepID=UPI001FEB712F|nr:type II toxin-antitoxin system mRNA interferase toxin, RelE/StbE family [Providencia huaxiensis]MDI7239000.1 type II toxin-antitoxin system mRNA interferase toxin, RelE/StbE family [Providencia huaxiensis]